MFGFQKAAATGIAFLALLFACLATRCALGQSNDAPREPVSADEPERGPPAVELVRPTIIVLKDKAGRLHPSPNMTLEELRNLVRLREERAEPIETPRFHFSQAAITGDADQEKATLNLNYGIVVHEARWVRVPLRLGGAILSQSSFEGKGVHFIEYDEKQAGYFAWIKPDAAGETHRVNLKILNRIKQVGDEHRLELKLPRVAATRDAPTLTLRVPVRDATATATSGSQACEVKASPQGEITQLQISQPMGDFSLVWRSTAREAVQAGPVGFNANSQIIVTWDSQSRVVWDAAITIHALRGQLSRVRVRFPPQTRLLPEDIAGQRVVADDGDETTADGGLWANVELERAIGEGQSREIRLRGERIVAPRDIADVQAIEIGGFWVEGATLQSGHIGIITADSLRANLTPGRGVYRQYEMPEGFHEAGVAGSRTYQFLSQPCEIKMSVAPRERRIAAAPVYLLRVTDGKLSITARVNYRVTGRTLNTCSTIFPGWEVEKVELSDGKSHATLAFDPPTESVLDIDLPQPLRGEFGLRIEASQPLPEEADFFAVNLPNVDADTVEGSQLVVVSADDLEVLLDADRSSGVAPSDDELPLELPPRQQRPQLYRIESQTDASFAATLVRHQRQIEISSEATVRITKSTVSLAQQLHYDVRYQPVLELQILLPTWLAASDSLRLAIDGEPISRPDATTTSGEDNSLLTLSLPRPRLGRISVSVGYSLQVSELTPGNVTASPISLAKPHASDIVTLGSEVTVETDKELLVETGDDVWKNASGLFQPVAGAIQWTADGIPDRLELLVTYDQERIPRSTVVERTWVQTWLTGRQRQDRAVLRLRTNEDAVRIQMPSSAKSSELMVLLDGHGIPVRIDAQQSVILPLLPEDAKREDARKFRRHVVEIGWRRDQQDLAVRRVPFDAPSVEGAWSQQLRWHVLTPRNRLILFPPSGMAAEATDSPWWWLRRSLLSQHELELWSGATAQPSAESTEQAATQRQYLFAGVGRADETSLVSCSAALAMLAVCAIAIGGVAIAVYVPRVRHPGVLLALSLAIAYLAFRWPTAGLFAGQTVGFALLVLLVSQLLQRIVVRRRRRVLRGGMAGSAAPARSPGGMPVVHSPTTTAQASVSLPLTPSEAP